MFIIVWVCGTGPTTTHLGQENIEATEEDIDKEMADFAAQYGQSVEDVKKMIGNDLHYFEEDVKMKKAIDMMFEKANFVAAKAKEEE